MATDPSTIEDTARTVKVPSSHWWRRLVAFVGPAYMVSVGYMDPGNWATDIQGGSQFGYSLIWVLFMSNAMAVLLQALSARLGLVTGRDLAQACRDEYSPLVRNVLFGLCEVAIAACDMAEVLGSAFALNLLFGIPILWAVLITAFDVLLLMMIQRMGIRKMEAIIVVLVATIGLCFVVQIWLSRVDWGQAAAGLVPRLGGREQLYVIMGIIGATVMPHNLYLHSSLVQSRDVARNRQSVAEACRFNLIDSVVAMNGACLINVAILVVAAASLAGQTINDPADASKLLAGVLGTPLAPIAFAIALLAAGQSSTVTGTLAGQITMEGFLNFRMRPWLRRLVTRLAAIVPAVAVIAIAGDKQAWNLLVFSQVVLSLQLPFAVVPLVKFTSSKLKMGPFANGRLVKTLAWVTTAVLIGLNAKLLYDEVAQWAALPNWGYLVVAVAAPTGLGLAWLLAYMIFRREPAAREALPSAAADVVARSAHEIQKRFRRIGVALEAKPSDAAMLAEAIAIARANAAEIVLMHVVEGVGGQWYGSQTGDLESRQDEAYVNDLAARLAAELGPQNVPAVRAVLGYGDVARALIRLAEREKVDMMVVGGHGHRGIADILHGTTISGVRHGLQMPILSVR